MISFSINLVLEFSENYGLEDTKRMGKYTNVKINFFKLRKVSATCPSQHLSQQQYNSIVVCTCSQQIEAAQYFARLSPYISDATQRYFLFDPVLHWKKLYLATSYHYLPHGFGEFHNSLQEKLAVLVFINKAEVFYLTEVILL